MSVRDRIEDGRLLYAAGKLEGALSSVLLAVAATSRKRYPNRKAMKDREAFVRFLNDERSKITGEESLEIKFKGKPHTLEDILYKYVRNCLIHEAELDEHISFEYGDFLLDRRGTNKYITFSSELINRLAHIVEIAPENKNIFPDGIYDRLPDPTDLKHSAVIKYTWGDDKFEAICWACSVVTEIWQDTSELITWLHLKGIQGIGGKSRGGPGMRLLVPTKYVTSIEHGSRYVRTKKRSNCDVGVFPPTKPTPHDSLNLTEIQNQLAEMQRPFVKNIIAICRPHYESDNVTKL